MGLLINPYSFAGLDAVTAAWLAQLTTSFGSNPSGSYISVLNTMIAGMRTDGDLTLLDRFWIFAQETQGYSRVSIVNPSSTQITEVNSPTWTASQGYTGNGSNMYLNTGFSWSTSSSNATQNSISHGVYVTTNVSEGKVDAGVNVSGRDLLIYSRYTDNKTYIGTNSNTGEASGSNTDSRGMFSGKRTASNSQSTLKNGSSIGTLSDGTNSLPNSIDFVLCNNTNAAGGAAPANYSTKRVAMRFIGSGSINHLNFYNRFQTFATSIGFNV